MSENKAVFNLGTQDNLFWQMDLNNPAHIRSTVEFDHEVDYEALKKAWDKTRKVFPIIDCVPKVTDGEVILYEDDRESLPIKSKSPIRPTSELAAGRPVSVTYYGKKLALSGFHAVVDGGGMMEIFQTLVYFYLAYYTGEEDENPVVQTKEGREVDEYYKIVEGKEFGEFERKPLVFYPMDSELFVDPEIRLGDDGVITAGNVKFSSEEFMKLCKKNGATPSAMLCIAIARAAYKLHPEERSDIAFSFTMSARNALNRVGYISNCLSMAVAHTTYEGVQDELLAQTSKELRDTMAYQRTPDYVKTMGEFCRTYAWRQIQQYALITYMRKFDVGKNTKHITDFNLVTNASMNAYMVDVNGEFVITLQFGKSTDRYLEAISEVITEMGVEARITEKSYPIVLDSDTATE